MNKIWTGWAIPDWRRLSWTDRLAWLIGSGFGSGFSPLAPGTAGSAVAGVIFYAFMLALGKPVFGFLPLVIVSLLAIAVGLPVGAWATGRMSTEDRPDPRPAVWDEFVGMWITCLPIPIFAFVTGLLVVPFWIIVPFFVFRALDTLKPWPCRQLERLHGGWGIMLDDVAAGVWGFLALGLLAVLVFATGLVGY